MASPTPGPDPDDVPLRKNDWELHRLIGQVACWSAELDLAMLVLYVDLGRRTGVPEPLKKAEGQGTAALRDLLLEVIARAPIAGTDIAARVAAIVPAAKTASEDRNDAVHGVWWSFEPMDLAVRIKRDGARPARPFTPNQLVDLAVRLKRAELDCVGVIYTLNGIDPSQPAIRD